MAVDIRYKARNGRVEIQERQDFKDALGEDVWKTRKFMPKKARIKLTTHTGLVRPREFEVGKGHS